MVHRHDEGLHEGPRTAIRDCRKRLRNGVCPRVLSITFAEERNKERLNYSVIVRASNGRQQFIDGRAASIHPVIAVRRANNERLDQCNGSVGRNRRKRISSASRSGPGLLTQYEGFA